MRIIKRILKNVIGLIISLFLTSLIMVFSLRFIPPVSSAFMLERYGERLFNSKDKIKIEYRWTSWKSISPHMALAAVASEDQKFPKHFGFDFDSIASALEDNADGGRMRGASTITQQVAKNLFLWKGKNFVRKGLEAYFTVLIEVLWPKRRILEIYLNVAEFGDGIYGIKAASTQYFKKPPAALSKKDAALLAAVLPNPKQLKAAAPSPYVRLRARQIEKQMKNLGESYLKDIWNG